MVFGCALWLALYFWLPETSQPNTLGIDKLLEGEENGEKGWRWVWLNPFHDLALLRSPNILAVVRICDPCMGVNTIFYERSVSRRRLSCFATIVSILVCAVQPRTKLTVVHSAPQSTGVHLCAWYC